MGVLRRFNEALGFVVVGALFLGTPSAVATEIKLYGNDRYERSSGHEGTYEWRGIYGYTIAYKWLFGLPASDGQHVSSFYIHDPDEDNKKHMEIGMAQLEGQGQPALFTQYSEDANRMEHDPVYYGPGRFEWGSTHKFVIRNLTMGQPDGVRERWIMSCNDSIVWNKMHVLTYGQAWTASETKYRGDDNRAHFWDLKRTSKPPNWQSWTVNEDRLELDFTHKFWSVGDNYWYNKPK